MGSLPRLPPRLYFQLWLGILSFPPQLLMAQTPIPIQHRANGRTFEFQALQLLHQYSGS